MRKTHDPDDPGTLTFTFGHEEMIIRRRYEVLSILNDLLIGLWFLIGSLLFFSPAMETAAIWLFVIGSAQLLIRPAIRLAQHIHLRRFPSGTFNV